MKLKLFSGLGLICLGLLAGTGWTLSCPLANKPPEIIASIPDYADRSNIAEFGFYITCKAAYPIEWDFDGSLPSEQSSRSHVTRYRRFSPNNSSCYDYESIFQTSILDETPSFSGKFTCFSISDPRGKRASFYKFYTGSDYKIFSHSIPEKVNLARKTPQGQYVVPCPANYERANVTLIKDLNDKEIIIPLGKNLTYDPRIGFFLNVDAFPDPTGKYKCLGTYGTQKYKKDYVDEVEIEILASDATESFSPETTYPDFQNGSLRLTCESNSEIYMDTTLVPPEFKISISGISTSGSGSHFQFVTSVLVNSTGNFNRGQITCHRKDTGARITTWKFDEVDRCRCVWDNWSKQVKKPDDPYGIFVCSPGIHGASEKFYACANPSECRLRTCPNAYNCPINNYGYFLHYGPFSTQLSYGILHCEVERLSNSKLSKVTIQKFQKRINVLPVLFENLIMITSQDSKTVLRVGDSQDFICKIHSNFLVEEIRWGLKFKNGSLTFLENASDQSGIRGTSIFVLEITKSIQISDMSIRSVYCFASAWETGEIKNSSISIFVQEQLQTVEDPKKTRCSNISDTPSILMKVRNPGGGGFKFYSVTGKDIVVPEPISFISEGTEFICMSNRLTEWHTNDGNELVIHRGGKNDVIKMDNNSEDYYCFLNTITIFSFSFESGNYTCREVGFRRNETKEASLYLFVKDEEYHLMNRGHENLIVDKSQEWTLIPCRANDPGTEVHLIRHDFGGRVVNLSTDPSCLQPYDPKKGFLIKTHLLYTDYNPSDIYICTSVFQGVEDDELTHVRSFGIERFIENWTLSEILSTSTNPTAGFPNHEHENEFEITTDAKECNENGNANDGYTLSAVLTPWLFAIVGVAVSAYLFIYARNLRWKLMKATCDGNASGPIIYQVGEDPTDFANKGQNSPNPILDQGIENPVYEKFE